MAHRVLVFALLLCLVPITARADDQINAVLGDASWTTGDPGVAPEVPRIQAHLRHVHDLLAARDASALSPWQRANRAAALDHLARYTEGGLFPRRTGDPYAGRRPRFIDDRGVHCAVGQLIADSGHADLARAIDERFEYAYVPDIAVPALAAWADTHGFTARELAMIQPTYGPPPSKADTQMKLEMSRDAAIMQCAGKHPYVASVTLLIKGSERGQVSVAAKGPAPFAKCVAAAVEPHLQGGAWRGKPRAFSFESTFKIPEPKALLAKAFKESEPVTTCLPRPGAIPKEAMYQLASTKDGKLVVKVTTTPANDEVQRCLQDRVWNMLAPMFEGAQVELSFETRGVLHSNVVAEISGNLERLGRQQASECRKTTKAPAKLTVTATAKLDAPALTLTTDATDPAFVTCFTDGLAKMLRSRVSVTRQKPDGSVEDYIRYDSDISVKATFGVP